MTQSAQTTEQLTMLAEDLSSELDKAHSDIADLRRLIKPKVLKPSAIDMNKGK